MPFDVHILETGRLDTLEGRLRLSELIDKIKVGKNVVCTEYLALEKHVWAVTDDERLLLHPDQIARFNRWREGN